MPDELPIFVKWMDFLEWVMPVMEKVPRRARASYATRVESLSLDVAQALVVARYTRTTTSQLQSINILFEQLRILLRIGQRLNYLSNESYRQGVRSIDEVGRMLGSWMKSISNSTGSMTT
jgi:hypothetical protein